MESLSTLFSVILESYGSIWQEFIYPHSWPRDYSLLNLQEFIYPHSWQEFIYPHSRPRDYSLLNLPYYLFSVKFWSLFLIQIN